VLSNGPVEVEDLLDEGRRLLYDREHARMRAFQGLTFANALGRILARWPDPTTLYKGPLGEKKRAAWSDPPLSLNEVKEVRKAFDATVNDVLLSAAAGALGRYLEARKDSEVVRSIRGLIPVNLRPVELDEDLGNKFGLVFLSLPIGIRDPVKRLAKLKETMDGLKSSVEPAVSYVLLSLLGALPDRLENLGTAFFDMKGTTVMTNVPGPQSQLYMAGAPTNTIMAWVPQSGSISLGISLISYNGKVWLGVATDEGLVPDPETIVEFFRLEFEALKAEAAQVTIATRETVEPMLSKLDHSLEVLDRLLAEAEAQKEAKTAAKKKAPAKKKTTRKKPAEAEEPPEVEPEAKAKPGEAEGEAVDEELAKSEEEVD
jgi:WS/DGAT/MGAT family acyltransferase